MGKFLFGWCRYRGALEACRRREFDLDHDPLNVCAASGRVIRSRSLSSFRDSIIPPARWLLSGSTVSRVLGSSRWGVFFPFLITSCPVERCWVREFPMLPTTDGRYGPEALRPAPERSVGERVTGARRGFYGSERGGLYECDGRSAGGF